MSLAVKGFSESTLRVREVYIRLFLRCCDLNEAARAADAYA
jgi:hypothetical protein